MENREIYLDNSATTKPLPEVTAKISEVLTSAWGNPSSLHHLGILAEKEMENARQQLAHALRVTEHEILFSPSATFASNAAIKGTLLAKKRSGNEIITTAVEHSATWNTVMAAEEEGFVVKKITPSITGENFAKQIAEQVTEKTILVTMIYVHNETGTIFPVEEAARLCKEKNPAVTVHVDGVQAFLKIPFELKNSSIDLLSITAHKVHGPKGIGVLFLRKGTRLKPVFYGGGQEQGFFPGTENVALMAGFGKAVELLLPGTVSALEEAREKKENLCNQLNVIPDVKILSPQNGLPYTLGFALLGIRSETMLHFLEARGIYVSSGSACAGGKKSRSLSAFGFNDRELDSYIRVSMNRETTISELEALVEGVLDAGTSLQRKR